MRVSQKFMDGGVNAGGDGGSAVVTGRCSRCVICGRVVRVRGEWGLDLWFSAPVLKNNATCSVLVIL